MRFGKIVVVALLLTVLPLVGVFAHGAGGFTWGQQYPYGVFSNVDLSASTIGVYGYNSTWGGQRYGGFAMAIHSDETLPAFKGGFIGAVAGQEMRIGPVVAAVNLWSGFGGLSLDPLFGNQGVFALFGELTIEVGFAILPGVLVTGYAGLQAIAPVLADHAFIDSAMYTPVLGMRFAWGG
jgi:hypothetical protein